MVTYACESKWLEYDEDNFLSPAEVDSFNYAEGVLLPTDER